MATKASWSYTAGEKGRNRVRAFEDEKTGIILLEYRERRLGCAEAKRKRQSVGHRDREHAKGEADELAAKLSKDEPQLIAGLTLRTLFDNYLREVTPQKGESKQKHDARCAEMFLRYLGGDRKASSLSRRDWDRFINARRSGVLRPKKPNKQRNGANHTNQPDNNRAVADRVIAYDLKCLLSALNWAALAGDGRGGMLLDRNPLRGLPLPKEENPKRPLVFQERYEAMLKVADSVDPRFGLALVLANETGHRIGSIRQLRWSDLDLKEKRITWRAENDKLGKQHVTPLSGAALAALDTERKKNPAVGDAWIFPAPGNVDRPECPSRPVSRHLVRDWWERAEALAELPHEPRMGWHSIRRKFATELKEKPLKDLCALGGWRNPQTILTCYQREDEATMREALATRKPLRAATAF